MTGRPELCWPTGCKGQSSIIATGSMYLKLEELTLRPRWEAELCCPLHTRMAVIRSTGRFSFCSSASGIRHNTANVSGLTPGGSGVGTPGLIGSLWLEVVADGATDCGGAAGLMYGTLVASGGAPVLRDGTPSLAVSGGRVVAERAVATLASWVCKTLFTEVLET